MPSEKLSYGVLYGVSLLVMKPREGSGCQCDSPSSGPSTTTQPFSCRFIRVSFRCARPGGVSPAGDELLPDGIGLPGLLHLSPRRGFVHAEYVAAPAIDERRHAVVGDAVDVHGNRLQLGHHGAEPVEIRIRRILEIDRDVDVGHAECT